MGAQGDYGKYKMLVKTVIFVLTNITIMGRH